ncbi:MAG: Uma2 family endonuclease [Actinomycetota bacterium]
MAVQPQPHRFSVDEYYGMAEAGLLGEEARLELIDGEIIDMTPIGSRHAACLGRLKLSFEGLGHRAIVRIREPVRLDEYDEPQPDLAVVEYRTDFYAAGHPEPEGVLLVVEVADTSAVYDRSVKIPLYARAGIREAWLVDMAGRRLEIHRTPSPEGYRHTQEMRPGDRCAPAALPDVFVDAGDLVD